MIHRTVSAAMTMMVVFATGMGCIGGVNGESVQLTVQNFEQMVSGKTIFIKFFAPWCSHCRAMKEDWDKLAAAFANHPIAVIAEVDCTADEGLPICNDFDVQGFPTLVYGDPMSAETYDGPRDYESLLKFSQENVVKPSCSIYQIHNCTPEQQAMIQSLEAKSVKDLEDIVAIVESKVKEKETAFDAKVAAIQKEYDVLVEEFNKALYTIKQDMHYKYVEQILGVRHEAAESQNAGADEL